jgi:integrase
VRDPCAKQRQTGVTRRQHLVEKVQLNGLVSPNYQYVVRRIFCFGSRRPGVQVPPPRPQSRSIGRRPVEVKGVSKVPAREQPGATVAEVDALATAVPAQYRAMVVMAAWCGLCFGELAALRRDRIGLLHGKVGVAETVTELASGERFAGPAQDIRRPPNGGHPT